MRTVKRYILPYVSALLCSVIGILIGKIVLDNTVVLGLLICLSFIPIILFALNNLLALSYIRKINQKKVAEMQSYLLKHREEAEKTATSKIKLLRFIRRLTGWYTVFVWLLAAATAVLAGALYTVETSFFWLLFVYSGIIFFASYSRNRRTSNIKLDGESTYIHEGDYPNLYSLANQAAKALNYCDEIKILLYSDCNIRIVKEKKRCILQIGVLLLNVISEEELFQILLHEFAHISEEESLLEREREYNSRLSSDNNREYGFLSFTVKMFVLFDVVYSFQYLIFDYATSVILETKADRAMAEYGSPDIAASALIKTQYYNMYLWEYGVKDEPSIYEPENLQADYLHNEINSFKKAYQDRAEFWNELAEKEIIANNTTHPTLKMRLKTLGINEIKTIDSVSSEQYFSESLKALDYFEQLIYEDRKESYQEARNENYLKPLKRIEEWTEKGMPISAEQYADVIDALRRLGRNEEAEALCDRVLLELNDNSSLEASFIKGCYLLHRYDENGLSYIYNAIENNANFLEEGLEIIGKFCCYTGREKELLEYRQKAVLLTQKNKDEDSRMCYLTKNDRLTKENLPEGMLEEILSYMLSVDEDIIKNIYLVRKTVSETFFASVFIIHFYGGTDAQRNEIMHKIFRFLDSYPTEWQFSLFDYFEYPEIKVEKIEGSLVYSKDDLKNRKEV